MLAKEHQVRQLGADRTVMASRNPSSKPSSLAMLQSAHTVPQLFDVLSQPSAPQRNQS